MWETVRGRWRGSSIGLREWCQGWRAWSMEGDWRGWICWHWRREETVLTWSNCSRFRIKGLSAIPWNSFRVDSSERTRGHSKKLVKGSFRPDIRKYFFSQRVVNRHMEWLEWRGGVGRDGGGFQEETGGSQKDEDLAYGLTTNVRLVLGRPRRLLWFGRTRWITRWITQWIHDICELT